MHIIYVHEDISAAGQACGCFDVPNRDVEDMQWILDISNLKGIAKQFYILIIGNEKYACLKLILR